MLKSDNLNLRFLIWFSDEGNFGATLSTLLCCEYRSEAEHELRTITNTAFTGVGTSIQKKNS